MKCGGCTACCKNLELHEIPSKIGELCKHCTATGCGIYNTRPKECQEFLCMWAQMDYAGEELRPDKCGVIFSRSSNDVIAARLDEDRMLNQFMIEQIKVFNREGFSVVVFRGNEKKFYPNDKHTKLDIIRAVHGRSIVY